MVEGNPMKRKWADVATVTLLVGQTKAAFHIHEEHLFEASPFFKAAFISDLRESRERIMSLPEDDESIFELFVGWLYHHHYDIPPPGSDPDHDRYLQPVKLFVLADKYDVRSLRNLVVSKLFSAIKLKRGGPQDTTIAYAFAHASQSSTIRKLLADYLAWHTLLNRYLSLDFQTWLQDHPDISAEVNVSFAKHTMSGGSPFHNKRIPGYCEGEE